jgi:formylglycine-generating enzyme required for sulfatase activity
MALSLPKCLLALTISAAGLAACVGAPAPIAAQTGAGAGSGVIAQPQVIKDCEQCPTLIAVPPGAFTMGSADGEPDRPETPIRRVNIAHRFAIGRTAVTQAQFARFIAAAHYQTSKGCGIIGAGGYHVDDAADWRNPGYGRPPRDDEPVVCVSWLDAKAYAHWLSQLTGRRYRLPSEAEWEYVAHAGTTSRYVWGEQADDACKHANLYDQAALQLNMPYAAANCSDGYVGVAPVASFPPNAFGVYDMIGNVWQWVEDCYLYEYPAWPVDGAPVEVLSACPLRSIRGGSWGTRVDRLRPTWRGRDPETRMNILFGFRVARDLDPTRR